MQTKMCWRLLEKASVVAYRVDKQALLNKEILFKELKNWVRVTKCKNHVHWQSRLCDVCMHKEWASSVWKWCQVLSKHIFVFCQCAKNRLAHPSGGRLTTFGGSLWRSPPLEAKGDKATPLRFWRSPPLEAYGDHLRWRRGGFHRRWSGDEIIKYCKKTC